MATYCSNCGKQLPEGASVCPSCGAKAAGSPAVQAVPVIVNIENNNTNTNSNVNAVPAVGRQKNKWVAFFLCLFLGFLGAHKFYEGKVGMGLHRPMAWQSDAIVTALPDTPLIGFYADCVVTLLYDPATRTAGVCHSGWRGMAAGILPKAVGVMEAQLGARRDSLIAVLGPSIRQECFETDADVPTAMEQQLGALVRPYIAEKGVKFHVDLQGIGVKLLEDAGLRPENVIDSGICTMCRSDEFWSHRKTHGVRGVQGAMICL